MDPYYGRGFQHDLNGYLSTEIFNYGYEANPNYGLMTQPEIHVEEPHDDYMHDYPSHNNQQMHQLYHDTDQYGNHGYQSPRQSHIYPYAPQRISFEPNPANELPSVQISVNIRLSRREYIDSRLINGLCQEGLNFEVRGSVITVTDYPSNNSPYGFLQLVREISGDSRATLERQLALGSLVQKAGLGVRD